jgi:hypothetical protein
MDPNDTPDYERWWDPTQDANYEHKLADDHDRSDAVKEAQRWPQ